MPVVFVNVTVVALTAPLNVVPPELVIVKVPMSVPIAPEAVTAPVVLIVMLEAEPLATPDTVVMLIGVDAPVPTVNVLPSEIVIAPKVI